MKFKEYLMEDALDAIIDYRGKTPQKSDTGIPTLSAKSVKNNHINYAECYYISEAEYKRFMVRGFQQKGDILLTTEAPMGMVAKLDRADVAIAQRLLTLRGKEGVLDNDYLLYLLQSPYGEGLLKERETGTTVTGIKQAEFRKIIVKLPDITIQKKIGSILSAIDQKITCNTKINDNLQQQAVAIFRQWFSVNPESEKWPVVTLDRLTLLISRGVAPKYDDDSTQIVLNQKCIRDHYIDTLQARRHKPKVINEKWLQYGDLLINSTGEGTLGRAAQVWFVPENMTVDSHVTIIRPKNQLLLFYIGLWGISHEREIEALHTGSTGQTELPRDRVKAMELRLPDNDTLTRFNAVIAPMVSAIVVNQQENARLAGVRDALLPRLMSGEIDVSEIDI